MRITAWNSEFILQNYLEIIVLSFVKENHTKRFWKPSIFPNAPEVEGMSESIGYSGNLCSPKNTHTLFHKKEMESLLLHKAYESSID